MMQTHAFTWRPNTTDREIFHAVVEANEYQLPPSLQPDAVVVDIGAHIGSFAYAALIRGAAQVYAFEANPRNHERAKAHLAAFNSRLKLFNAAVWRSDQPDTQLEVCNNDYENWGGSNVWSGMQVSTVIPSRSLDSILLEASGNGKHRINLLKIDCEGAEFPILLTASQLACVDWIVGEFHEFKGEFDGFPSIPEALRMEGYESYTIHHLETCLNRHGFDVEWSRSSLSHIGHFCAYRRQSGPMYETYFQAQLADLKTHWAVNDPVAPSLLRRIQRAMTQAVFGQTLQQQRTVNATLTRVIEGLVAQLDHEQQIRRRKSE